jgi:hypothetical protein
MGTQQKCKYWAKCYRKDKDHKKNFLHPGDEDGDTGIIKYTCMRTPKLD